MIVRNAALRGIAPPSTMAVNLPAMGSKGTARDTRQSITYEIKTRSNTGYLKMEVEFWSCDCIVKETVWNRPVKVDRLAYKNLCVLQGSGIIKMIRNLAKSW